MSNAQIFLLAVAAMTSVLVAAAVPSGPSMLSDRTWSDDRPAFQQVGQPDRLRR